MVGLQRRSDLILLQMSNALAIAAVTETLVQLISDNLAASGVGGAQVTGLAPDGDTPMPEHGVNVFLYQVSPNPAYRNADLVTRGPDGSLIKKPQVALDLHYLITFYGDDTKLEQQRLLGATALALHANPVLSRTLIQSVQAATTFLNTSTLDTQVELVRLAPIVFSVEELSKLWSFLLKIDYVLSAAYTASVVLIQADDAVPGPAPPVLSYSLDVLPFSLPVIQQVTASPNPNVPIADGSTIVLTGTHLAATGGATTTVVVSGTTLMPSATSDKSVTLTLPTGAFPAGVHSVQVMQSLSLGSPAVPHPGTGVASGAAAFVLAPTITPGSVALAAGPAVNLQVTPLVQPNQHVALQLTSKSDGTTKVFDGGVLTTASATLSIPTPALPSGTYLVRVLVDAAVSPLTPPTGTPTGPLLTV